MRLLNKSKYDRYSAGFLAAGGAVILILRYCKRSHVLSFSDAKDIVLGAVLSGIYFLYTKQKYLNTIQEVKFVKNTNKPCRGHVYSKEDCTQTARAKDPSFECSYSVMRWMIDILDSAQESLDLSLYLATCQDYNAAVMRAHARGVRIRLITDHIMAQGTGSVVPKYISEGIPIRMNVKTKMMHRKSAVIDGKISLLGTGNWTMQALAGNFETWMKTTDPHISAALIEALDYQWNEKGVLQPTIEEFNAFKQNLN